MAVHFHPQPKPRPAALERADRRRALQTTDEKESDKVRDRSRGQCEVHELRILFDGHPARFRCERRACEVNHLLGGNGRRARGESAKAIRKIHMCKQHHSDYHAHILRRVGGVMPLWSDRYERVK